jgi:hypothetical protein
MRIETADLEDLKPILAEFGRQLLKELGSTPLASGRIGFTERQGAEALGIAPHVLRDARLRGAIHATKHAGMKQYLYSRRALIAFAEGKQINVGRKNGKPCSSKKST